MLMMRVKNKSREANERERQGHYRSRRPTCRQQLLLLLLLLLLTMMMITLGRMMFASPAISASHTAAPAASPLLQWAKRLRSGARIRVCGLRSATIYRLTDDLRTQATDELRSALPNTERSGSKICRLP